jgi:hypothetical protein
LDSSEPEIHYFLAKQAADAFSIGDRVTVSSETREIPRCGESVRTIAAAR